MKYSGIGGQAVIEGIMMRNGNKYAVAVRKPDQEIEVKVEDYKSVCDNGFAKLPFIRGTFNFIDSLVLGMKIILYSASFFEDEEEEKEPNSKFKKDKEPKAAIVTESRKNAQDESEKKSDTGFMVLTVILSLVIAIGLFMVLPVFLANLIRPFVGNGFLMSLIEGLVRVAIFMIYIVAISAMNDIKRTYMYHGGEHKCINCIEHGLPLTVDNVRKSSRFHKRCGTSFLLIVMLVSVLVFMWVQVDTLWLKMLSRIVLIPVVAGISYEFLRLAGKSDNWLVNLLSKPGLCLQHLTTKEPDDDMIEVAIESVEAVFDWKEYLLKEFPENEAEILKAALERQEQKKAKELARQAKEAAMRVEQMKLDPDKTGYTDLTEPGVENDEDLGLGEAGALDRKGFTNLSGD